MDHKTLVNKLETKSQLLEPGNPLASSYFDKLTAAGDANNLVKWELNVQDVQTMALNKEKE